MVSSSYLSFAFCPGFINVILTQVIGLNQINTYVQHEMGDLFSSLFIVVVVIIIVVWYCLFDVLMKNTLISEKVENVVMMCSTHIRINVLNYFQNANSLSIHLFVYIFHFVSVWLALTCAAFLHIHIEWKSKWEIWIGVLVACMQSTAYIEFGELLVAKMKMPQQKLWANQRSVNMQKISLFRRNSIEIRCILILWSRW